MRERENPDSARIASRRVVGMPNRLALSDASAPHRSSVGRVRSRLAAPQVSLSGSHRSGCAAVVGILLVIAFMLVCPVSAMASGYSSTVLSDSPVGYWRLDDTSGTSAADSSGNGYNGTFVNSPTKNASGAVVDGDAAVSFNGTSQYAHRAFTSALNPSHFTVEAWVYPTGSGSRRILSAAQQATSTKDIGYTLGQSSAAKFYIGIFDGTNNIGVGATDTTVRSRNAWYYLVGTYDGTNLRLYVNGALVATSSASYAPATSEDTFIGRDWNTNYWAGTIDEPAIYSTALSASRIAAHYEAGTGGTPTVSSVTAASTSAGVSATGSAVCYSPGGVSGSSFAVTVGASDSASWHRPRAVPRGQRHGFGGDGPWWRRLEFAVRVLGCDQRDVHLRLRFGHGERSTCSATRRLGLRRQPPMEPRRESTTPGHPANHTLSACQASAAITSLATRRRAMTGTGLATRR